MALRHIVRNEQSIGIRAKKYFSLDQSRYILDEYCKTLGHRTHGLVFQPINEVHNSNSSRIYLFYIKDFF
jgi:hypothetical protein